MALVATAYFVGRHFWGVKAGVGVATALWLIEVFLVLPWALIKDARRPVDTDWGSE